MLGYQNIYTFPLASTIHIPKPDIETYITLPVCLHVVTVLPFPLTYTHWTLPSKLLTLNKNQIEKHFFFYSILPKARSKKPGTPYGPSPYGTRHYCTITMYVRKIIIYTIQRNPVGPTTIRKITIQFTIF